MGLGYKVWNRIIKETRAEEEEIKAELEVAGVRPTWKIESSSPGFVEYNPPLPELRLMLQVTRLRSALEKYGDPNKWDDCLWQFEGCDDEDEPWKLAQEALKDAD